jgi:hypothetical protein
MPAYCMRFWFCDVNILQMLVFWIDLTRIQRVFREAQKRARALESSRLEWLIVIGANENTLGLKWHCYLKILQ